MSNQLLIETFYEAFSKRDYETMRSSYHAEAVFRDEVFELQEEDIGFMWEMLCKRGKDLKVIYEVMPEVDGVVRARWEAYYTFSATKRKVHNIINAEFRFKDGKIIEHIDRFDFWRWSKQALGIPGFLLGWSTFLKKKVQAQAADSLNAFISGHSNN